MNNGYGYKQDGGACISPGPVIRLQAGKRFLMVLHNNVPGETTNLHTHGLHIAGHGNSDDITRTVAYGDCLAYSWEIEEQRMGGTAWCVLRECCDVVLPNQMLP